MSPLPIVLATHEFFPTRGGVGVYVQELAAAAMRQGREVCVLAPRHPRQAEIEAPVPLEGLPRPPWPGDPGRLAATAWHLLRQRRRLRGCVLHLCQQGPLRVMMALRLAGLVRPARLLVTLHGSELLQLSAGGPGRRGLAALLARADRVAVLSGWVRDQLASRFPAAGPKTVLTPGAPRSSLLGSPGVPRPRAGGRLTLLSVGRIHPRKGQAALLRALARLDGEAGARLRCVMVGPVIDRAYARELARLAGACRAEVVMAGEVDDEGLARHYEAADLFALTSEATPRSVEGFGIVCLEASANGLPVLAHRTGGVEDAVRTGVTGLLVEPGDDAALADALRRLAGDPDLRRRLGDNGRRFASGFSWDACASATYGDLPS